MKTRSLGPWSLAGSIALLALASPAIARAQAAASTAQAPQSGPSSLATAAVLIFGAGYVGEVPLSYLSGGGFGMIPLFGPFIAGGISFVQSALQPAGSIDANIYTALGYAHLTAGALEAIGLLLIGMDMRRSQPPHAAIAAPRRMASWGVAPMTSGAAFGATLTVVTF